MRCTRSRSLNMLHMVRVLMVLPYLHVIITSITEYLKYIGALKNKKVFNFGGHCINPA